MPPASPNARPAFSHVLVFLLAVITFSISYAVSSLAATVQTATNGRALQEIRPTFRRGYQGPLLPKTSRISVQAGQYIDVTLLDPLQRDARSNNRTFLVADSMRRPLPLARFAGPGDRVGDDVHQDRGDVHARTPLNIKVFPSRPASLGPLGTPGF